MDLHQVADTALIVSQLITLIALRLAIKRGDEWRDDWTRARSDHLIDRAELMCWRSAAATLGTKTGNPAEKNEQGGN